MKKIIFDFQLDGHNLEYLHHLYVGAMDDMKNEYIFSLPSSFENVKHHFEWPKANNITFKYFEDDVIWAESDIVISLKSCIYLRKLVKETGAKEIILVWLMNVIPFLPFFISSKIKVTGILYRIYLYTWKDSSFLTKIGNILKYYVISHSRCIKTAFVLNDYSSVAVLNRVWHTDKFKFLTDPYVAFNKEEISDLRNQLADGAEKKVILHLGAMSYRKGTMSIVEMIEKTTRARLDPFVFVFAGRIYPDIKDDFYKRVACLKEIANIVVMDDFLPYAQMGSLVYSSDALLLPYNHPDMSSGSIAYAAEFSKPVFVPKRGLLAKLVKRYHLGKLVDDFSSIDYLYNIPINESDYCASHTVKEFNRTLFS